MNKRKARQQREKVMSNMAREMMALGFSYDDALRKVRMLMNVAPAPSHTRAAPAAPAPVKEDAKAKEESKRGQLQLWSRPHVALCSTDAKVRRQNLRSAELLLSSLWVGC